MLTAVGLLVGATRTDPMSLILPIAYGGAGAYVAFRRPTNPIGWLLTMAGLGVTLGSVRVHASPDALLAGDLSRGDLESVTGDLHGTVEASMRPATLGLWLRSGGR
jgi:hypothetical protein